MLSKLIRYEWKAVARVCIPMYGGLILAAMLTHFLLGNLERFSSTLYDIITMAMSTLCFGLFMAAFVLTLIIQIQRFSKNLLGDEGYLMFTLPASVSQHITAKLVVAVLLDVLSVAAAILAVLALALDGTMWLDLPGDFFDMIVYVDWSDWLLLLELLLLCLAAGRRVHAAHLCQHRGGPPGPEAPYPGSLRRLFWLCSGAEYPLYRYAGDLRLLPLDGGDRPLVYGAEGGYGGTPAHVAADPGHRRCWVPGSLF